MRHQEQRGKAKARQPQKQASSGEQDSGEDEEQPEEGNPTALLRNSAAKLFPRGSPRKTAMRPAEDDEEAADSQEERNS